MGSLPIISQHHSVGAIHYLRQLAAGNTALVSSLFSLLLFWPSVIQADNYRYRDINGMGHYMDHQQFIVKPLPASGKEHALNRDGVLMRVLEQGDEHYLLVLNRLDTLVTLKLEFSQTHNLAIPAQLEQAVLLPAKTETLIGKLTPQTAGDWRYKYDFSYQYGNQQADTGQLTTVSSAIVAEIGQQKTAEYFPASNVRSRQNSASRKVQYASSTGVPYQGAKHDLASPVVGAYRIAQGFNGAFSHNHVANRYALDIALPVGTPLYASRAGVVVAAVDYHVGGGLDAKYRGKANHLRVRHSDGSMTLYAHLHTGSLRVAKGEQIRLGQPIAASGNTGYTSGPHLHLALQVDQGGQRQSVPFTLQGSQPLAGLWLTGPAWGAE